MKFFKPALLYLLAAALLGSYIWFFERKPKEDAASKKAKLFSFVADDVKALTFANPGAEHPEDRGPIALKKDDKGVWTITAPREYEADTGEVRNVLSTVMDFNPDTKIENYQNLSEFGLDRPAAQLAFGLAAGGAATLFVGQKTINDMSYFVKSHNDPAVYVVPLSYGDVAKKTVKELRNKVLFETGYVEAKKVVMERPGKAALVLERKDDRWVVQRPDGGTMSADEDTTRQFLNLISQLRILDFIDRPNLSELKLADNNRGTIEIWPSDGSNPVEIVFGGKVKGKSNEYIRRKDRSFAAIVPDYLSRDTDKSWTDFRDKGVMRLPADAAVKLEISRPGLTLTYQKAPEGPWVCPGREKANDEAVGIVDALGSCRVQAFVPDVGAKKAGTDKPLVTARVTLKDGKVRLYRFGNHEEDKIYLASDVNQDLYLVYPPPANSIENVLAAPPPSFTPGK